MSPKRRNGAVRPFQLRLAPALKQRLETRAEQHGLSLNAEIIRLLEASLAEEQAAGGAGMRRLTIRWRDAFLHGGEAAARARNKSWNPDYWLNDPFVYTTARYVADRALREAAPKLVEGATPELLRTVDAALMAYARRITAGDLTVESLTLEELVASESESEDGN